MTMEGRLFGAVHMAGDGGRGFEWRRARAEMLNVEHNSAVAKLGELRAALAYAESEIEIVRLECAAFIAECKQDFTVSAHGGGRP